MLSEFKEFIQRGNVVDVVVGIVIGAAFGVIVSTFVDGVLMPPIGLLLGGVNFEDIFTLISDGNPVGPYANLAEAQRAGAVVIQWGTLINAIIKFVIVAFAVFLVVKAVNRMLASANEEEAGPSSEELLAEIRDLLKK